MWFVTRGASLSESRLVKMRLLELIGLIGMARKTSLDGIGLQKSRSFSGVRIVAGYAFPLRARVLNLCLFDLLRLLTVARHTKRPGIAVGQHDLAIFRGRVTRVAGASRERRVRERLHQLRPRRLMRTVALCTGCGSKGLALVRLRERRVFRIVAVDAEGRGRVSEMVLEFLLAAIAGFMGDVAGVATHIESSVVAALLRNIQSLSVAIQTEIGAFIAGGRLQELVLVVGLMWVVTLGAVPDRGRMDRALRVSRVLVGVAGDA